MSRSQTSAAKPVAKAASSARAKLGGKKGVRSALPRGLQGGGAGAPAPDPRSSPLTDALNAAAWAEADLHFARAWRETDGLCTDLTAALAALARRERGEARPSAAHRRLAAAVERAGFAAERMAATARVRRLDRTPLGPAAFDPAIHTVGPDAPIPARGVSVEVVMPAIVRSAGPRTEVLVRALVTAPEPVKAAAKSGGKTDRKRSRAGAS